MYLQSVKKSTLAKVATAGVATLAGAYFGIQTLLTTTPAPAPIISGVRRIVVNTVPKLQFEIRGATTDDAYQLMVANGAVTEPCAYYSYGAPACVDKSPRTGAYKVCTVAIPCKDCRQAVRNIRTVPTATVYEWVFEAELWATTTTMVYPEIPTTQTIPLTTPTNLTATASSGGDFSNVTLTWTDTSVGETGFSIMRSLDSTHFYEVGVTGRNATSWKDCFLPPNTTFQYQIQAMP